MSTIKANNHQVGQSPTASNNFTWYQPSTPDGTVRLGVGNSGATTSDVVTVTGSTGAAVFSGSVKSAATGFIFPDNTTQTTAATAAFAAGTKTNFFQAAAPTGWTQCTTYNDYSMRVVSGTGGGIGGTVNFSTAFSSSNTGATTLTTCQIPSHLHTLGRPFGGSGSVPTTTNALQACGTANTSSTGGGGSHTHSLALAVKYIDNIIATKN